MTGSQIDVIATIIREDVSFTDPLNQLKGKAKAKLQDHASVDQESYKANVEMLSGNSLVGTGPYVRLHILAWCKEYPLH